MPQLITEKVNLNLYPTAIAIPKAGSEITLGDLDGDSIKLMYSLIREGVVELAPKYYQQMLTIYETYPLSKEDIKTFNHIMSKMKIVIPCPKVRLIGDELADRGNNDYFTLKIFEKLDQLGVNFEILASNHGMQFLKQYAEGLDKENITSFRNIDQHRQYERFGISLHRLQALIRDGLVAKEEIDQIVQNHYLNKIKLMSYELDMKNEKLSLYTHAPTLVSMLKPLAENLNIIYTMSPYSIDCMLDDFNQKFQENLQSSESIKQWCENPAILSFVDMRYNHLHRYQNHFDFKTEEPEFSVDNIHGHVGEEDMLAEYPEKYNFINLDLCLKKSKVGTYTVYTNNPHYRPYIPEASETAVMKEGSRYSFHPQVFFNLSAEIKIEEKEDFLRKNMSKD